MKRLPLILVGATVLLVVAGFWYMAPADSPDHSVLPAIACGLTGANVTLAQYGSGFDRETCEQECRSRYGVDPYAVEEQFRGGRGGGGYRSGYYLYAYCIDACNRTFWKEFDRKMDQLERE